MQTCCTNFVRRLPTWASEGLLSTWTVMMECERLDSRFSSWLPTRRCAMPRLMICGSEGPTGVRVNVIDFKKQIERVAGLQVELVAAHAPGRHAAADDLRFWVTSLLQLLCRSVSR